MIADLYGFNKYQFIFSEIAVNAACHTQDVHQCPDSNAECKSNNGIKCLCKDAYYLKGSACTSRMSFCRTIHVQLYSVTGLTRDSTIIQCNSIDHYNNEVYHAILYVSDIVAVSFIGGGNRRKPPTCHKSPTSFITSGIEYIYQYAGFELTALDSKGSYTTTIRLWPPLVVFE